MESKEAIEAPKPKGRKPKSEDQAGVAIEIECTPQTREKEAEAAFLKHMDETGGVLAVNSDCGGSVYFPDLAKFPRVNQNCTCGNPKHFIVKYKFI